MARAPAGGGTPATPIPGIDAAGIDDAGYATAVAVVASDRKVSPGHLHRRLGIGEIAAAAYIDRMETEGLVGAPNAFGRRRIHIAKPVDEARSVA